MFIKKGKIYVLVLVFILCFGNNSLFSEELRTIKIHVLYDIYMETDLSWQKNLSDRFIEINNFYNSKFGINWEISTKSKYKFDGNFKSIAGLFSKYKDQINTQFKEKEVIICIIGRNIPGRGIAGVFSKIIMISNTNNFQHRNSGVIIAHELGHLFGAWHTRRADDLMFQRGAKYYKAGIETTSIIKLMRNYDFKPSILLKNSKLLRRISRLYSRFHTRSEADPTVRRYSLKEVNPVARLYADEGISNLKNKEYNIAVKNLENSVKYDVGWGNSRMYLAKAYYFTERFNESFTELTRAVFYGARSDAEFENKLKNKFLELSNQDPTISNPFTDHK